MYLSATEERFIEDAIFRYGAISNLRSARRDENTGATSLETQMVCEGESEAAGPYFGSAFLQMVGENETRTVTKSTP
jgi:hypothetical protein